MLLQQILSIIWAALMGVGALCGLAYIKSLFKKGDAETMVTLAIASGDSESMTFQTNFNKSDSEEEKKAKVDRLFAISQARRDFNHEQWLKVKAEAEKENAEKLKEVK